VTPKERVLTTLDHREPDRIPWGEHSIDYNVYEDILGRPTLVQAKFRQTKAYWEGRRVPPKGYHPEPLEQLDEVTFRNKAGDLFRISATTHDLRPYKINRPPAEPTPPSGNSSNTP